MFIIRIKALFLSVIFAGNFFAVCPCAAKDATGCPGKQAVKFNLLEKKAAGMVEVSPADAIGTLGYLIPVIEGRLVWVSTSSWCLPLHAPPDRLALYHCYLI
jgi:hypothetical protein